MCICKKLGHSIHFYPLKFVNFRRKIVKRVWIPKGVNTSQNENDKKKWIPKGTKILSSNNQGPKKVWVPKTNA